MHSILFSILVPFTLASTDFSPKTNLLQRRQGGDAFIPNTTPVFDCAPQDICGVDCIEPELGDVCCPEDYGCPGGSFCLTNQYCCPDGDNPSDCANQFGVTLPAGYNPSATISGNGGSAFTSSTAITSTPAVTASTSSTPIVTASTSSTPTVTASTSSTPIVTARSTPSTTPISSFSAAPVSTSQPFHSVSSSATVTESSSSAHGTSTPVGSPVPFTGGTSAMRVVLDGGIVAVIVAGIVKLLV